MDIELKKELDNCDFVKTILMMAVILYHSCVYWNGTWFDHSPLVSCYPLSIFAGWLGSFHNYSFVLTSGFIFYYLRYVMGKYGEYRKFILNKVKRLVIPYFFVAIIWIAPFQIIFFHYDFVTLFENIILAKSPNQLWFLWMLFWIFLIYYKFSDFFRKYNIKGLVIVISIYCIGMVAGYWLPNYYQIWSSLQYLVFFWIGGKLCQYRTCILRRMPWWVLLGIDILLYCISLNIRYNNFPTKTFKYIYQLLLHIWGSVSAFLILQKIANNHTKKKYISFWYKRSMTVYMFHQQIIFVVIYLLNGINPYLNAMINFCGALLISLVICELFLKTKKLRMCIGLDVRGNC
jgi:fucose 4-O-acetylase-like acetyltransferase